jgi:PhnB protein
MTSLHPYINFSGKAREAMTAYADVFRGQLTISTFGDFVLHASDGQPHHVATPGNNVSMSLQLTDQAEQTRIFDALAEGGQVLQPLASGPWGARFGMLVDRFGIQWMLNCPT